MYAVLKIRRDAHKTLFLIGTTFLDTCFVNIFPLSPQSMIQYTCISKTCTCLDACASAYLVHMEISPFSFIITFVMS